jgi:hypothetical protein
MQMPRFDGSSYLRHPGLGDTGLIWLELEVVFKLTSEDEAAGGEGLLLYNGDRTDGQGDFMAVYVHRGYLEFAFDVGNGIAIARFGCYFLHVPDPDPDPLECVPYCFVFKNKFAKKNS